MGKERFPDDTLRRQGSSKAAPTTLVGVPLSLTALLTSHTSLSLEGMMTGLISGVEMRPR